MIVVKLKNGKEFELSYDWASLRRVENLAGGKAFHKVVTDCGATDLAALIGGGAFPNMRNYLVEEIGELLDMVQWSEYAEKIASAMKRDLQMAEKATVLKLVPQEE